jgi:hypothetical protein
VKLPEGVEKASAKGGTYYYWNPGRGTARQGTRIKLPNGDTNPDAFWKEMKLYTGTTKPVPLTGSVGYLVQRYRESEEFKSLSESTQSTYGVHLNRFEAAWASLPYDLPDGIVTALRDSQKDTPGMANHMLSVGRSMFGWANSIGVKSNPFRGVKDFDTLDKGHVPWPAWAVDVVCEEASPDLMRMVRLGLMTCQRESDLVRMGPAHRNAKPRGIWCRPKKTRKKRKTFCIPLTAADAITLDRWETTAITFTATRWLKPIARHNPDLYLYSPRGVAYSGTSLRARWHRWPATPAGVALCERWRAWIAEMVQRYEWDFQDGDLQYPTIHGLRGTGILIRRADGHDIDQISNDIGMSRPMVERYMRFRDQMEVAAAGQAKLKVVAGAKPT